MAMLSSVFKHRGLDLSSNRNIKDLLKSFDKEKCKKDNSLVSWNRDVVLKRLAGPSFEPPLRSAFLRNLTHKTLFLFVLATAKHISELQAFDKKLGFSQGDEVCSFTLGFLAKDEDPSKPWPRSFMVKNLTDILGQEEKERELCVQSEH